MNSRRAKVFRIKTDKENHIIKVDLTYSKGGMSFWDYKHYPEGIYLHVQPVEIQPTSEGILSCEMYVGGTGVKTFIEAGARFSAKRLNNAADTARQTKGESLANFSDILKQVCERDGFDFEKLVIE